MMCYDAKDRANRPRKPITHQVPMVDCLHMKSPVSLLDQASLGAVLVLTLVLGYAGGSWVAYLLMIGAISIAFFAAARREHLWLAGDWAARAFFSAFVLLAIAFTINRDVSHVFNFLMFLLFAPLSAAFSRLAKPGNALWVAHMANVGCGIAFVIACYQVFGLHMARASAFGSDPIWSAQAGVIIAFIALLGLTTTDKPWRIVFAAGPVAMSAVVALSGSRGPILAVPVLFGVFLVLGTRRWWLSVLMSGIAAALLIAAAAWLWPEGLQRLFTVQTVVSDIFGKGQISEASGGERQLMYEAGLAAFRASPLFGYGWEHLMTAIAPYVPGGLETFQTVHHHLHSDVLDFAISGGVLGLISYVLVLAAPYLGTSRSRLDSQYQFRSIASIGLGLGYAIFGISYLTFGYEYHTTLYVCLAAILVGYCRDHPQFEI